MAAGRERGNIMAVLTFIGEIFWVVVIGKAVIAYFK
jgi:hypothetical protein